MADQHSGSKKDSSLTESAYKILKEKIVCGELKQGEVISIAAMAKTLDISRTPLANACLKLERDRMVTIVPKQGVVINSFSIIDAREIYELRAAVETYSAKRAFDYATKKDIETLKDLYRKQEEYVENNDIKKFMNEDLRFHKYLLSIKKNTQFLRTIDEVMDKAYLLGLESCKTPKRLRASLDEHKEIINALSKKDKGAFVAAVERNILNGLINLTGDRPE